LSYLHGSFLEEGFRDIDVALCLAKIGKSEALQVEKVRCDFGCLTNVCKEEGSYAKHTLI
jgi:hypothetical protein